MPRSHSIDTLPPWRDKETLNVLVESAAGSRVKLKYEPETGLFGISKMLPEGFVFPYDFGFIPGTRGEDGDPLDVMLVAEAGSTTGCLVEARPLGLLVVEQTRLEAETGKAGKTLRNDRILAVPLASRRYAQLAGMDDLPGALQKEIEYFLASYGRLDGLDVRIVEVRDAPEAVRLIRKAAHPPGSHSHG